MRIRCIWFMECTQWTVDQSLTGATPTIRLHKELVMYVSI